MQIALEELSDDDTQQASTRNEADGLIRKMDLFETAVMTTIWSTLLERFNKVNKQVLIIKMTGCYHYYD